MSHACEYCAETHKRRMLFRMLVVTPNLVSSKAAREIHISRSSVMTWREEGVRRGCVPPRTMTGQRIGGVAGGHAKAAISANRILHPVCPIGTLCTDERTVRAA